MVTMRAYRHQIRKTCRRLGQYGRTFDYRDVLNALPPGVDPPTEWEVIRVIQHCKLLEVAERGRHRKLTKYRLRVDINARADIEGQGEPDPHKATRRQRGPQPDRHSPTVFSTTTTDSGEPADMEEYHD